MPLMTMDFDRRISNRIKLRDLHILSTVVQLGSMAKAASHLAITQPTVSQAIADLEHAVGVRLLDRGPHGVAVTVYGQTLLKRGLEAFDALNQGMRDIEFISAPNAGDVWVGCSDVLSGGFVPAVIQGLAKHYPKVLVHAVTANTSDNEFERLRSRELDLIMGRLVKTQVDDDLCVEVLFDETMSVVVSARSPWARRRRVKLADLADESWIFGEPENPTQAAVSAIFAANGLASPKIGLVTTAMSLRLPLLATGNYIAAIPNSLLKYSLERWSLKILPVRLGVRYPVGILTLKNRTLSPVVQLFFEHARSVGRAIASKE